MMNADLAVASNPSTGRRAKDLPTHLDVEVRAPRSVGGPNDSQQPLFLVRYAALKRVTPERLDAWLEQLTDVELVILRYVFETVVFDCDGEPSRLTAEPFMATAEQLKLVPQFFGDGSPLGHFRLPKLNTVDAIDDALGAQFLPALHVADQPHRS